MSADNFIFLAESESESLDLLTALIEQKQCNTYDFCKFNRLVLNTSKTNLVFAPFDVTRFNICRNRDIIKFLLSFKYLMVVIDKNLKYYDQVNQIRNKII